MMKKSKQPVSDSSFGHYLKLNGRQLKYDSLMVLLNLSMSCSILPYLLFFQSKRLVCVILITLLDILYMLHRFRLPTMKNEPMLLIFVLLHIVALISSLITGNPINITLGYLVLNSVFYYFLYCLFRDYSQHFDLKQTMWLMVRGYIWLEFICIVSCVILFALMKVGVYLHTNNVTMKYDLFYAGSEDGKVFFMPYYLGVLLTGTSERLAGFQTAGTICGIYFEPHIVAFMTFPALFLLLYYYSNLKIVWASVYLLIVLLTVSTTNLISLLGCLVVYYFYMISSFSWKKFLSLVVFSIALFLAATNIDWDSFQFVANKLDDSGSMQYSQSTIEFAFTPKTLIGTNFYSTSWVRTGETYADVGYVNFVLNIVYLLLCAYYLLKIFFIKTPLFMAFLLFGCYFLFHSAKLAMSAYSLTMLTFVMFCVSHLAKCKYKQKNEKNTY